MTKQEWARMHTDYQININSVFGESQNGVEYFVVVRKIRDDGEIGKKIASATLLSPNAELYFDGLLDVYADTHSSPYAEISKEWLTFLDKEDECDRINPSWRVDPLYISNIAVNKKHRGNRIGYFILYSIMEMFSRHDVVYLFADKHSKFDLIKYYEGFGFSSFCEHNKHLMFLDMTVVHD